MKLSHAAKEADVVVAFVGLSPHLEGEEMRIKIDGFSGGDRTSLALPAAQEKLLKRLRRRASRSSLYCRAAARWRSNWAKDHANAVVAAWYPGVEGGTAIAARSMELNNPAGRLPVTFYASVDDLPAFSDYSMKNRTYRYYTGQATLGFWVRTELHEVSLTDR